MSRRLARETALQVLYQLDMTKAEVNTIIKNTLEQLAIRDDAVTFMKELVLGTVEHQEKVDQIISKLSIDWNLDRMPIVDRNVLRLALYEILYRNDIPAGVAVNEAIELAKTFSNEQSGKFVNGILGSVVQNMDQYR